MSNIALQPVDAASITVLVDNQVTYPLPDNCTGWPATAALAAQCPDAFVQCTVGTRVSI